MIERVVVRRGEYRDSVRLMTVSSMLQDHPGVRNALVAMATPLNLELLGDLGFDTPDARQDDLVVALRAADEASLAGALAALDDALEPAPPDGRAGWFETPLPRTVEHAARRAGANLALISVPGRHAFVEAMAALQAGLHVMVFSNNVPIEREIELKAEGERRGLLVMGPDCGTAIIGGVGLGFANATVPGPVGVVGASGTGIQHLVCLLDEAGIGIRHAIGTGSRDLSAPVAGRSTLAAIDALEADPGTELIALVSKPPDPAVGRLVSRRLARCTKRTVEVFIGAKTIEEGAALVCAALGRQASSPAEWGSTNQAAHPGVLSGLFSGGSLRAEAAEVVAPIIGPAAAEPSPGRHTLVDFGDDRFTQGRPHPMIDFRLRRDALEAAVRAPGTGVILFDLVLGYGAHPNPSDELVAPIREAAERQIPVVVSLCGTRRDPQGREAQAERLVGAGAAVFASNSAAAAYAAHLTKADSA